MEIDWSNKDDLAKFRRFLRTHQEGDSPLAALSDTTLEKALSDSQVARKKALAAGRALNWFAHARTLLRREYSVPA